jgi:RNA ligase (TIGR02306 family)
MSELVYIDKVREIRPIPGADRIELAVVGAYQSIIAKGSLKPQDDVVFIGEDALVTHDILMTLGLVGKLGGAEKNRVRTTKMRGVVSQGLVAPLSAFGPICPILDDRPLAERLGITKYEPPVGAHNRTSTRPEYLKPLPSWVPFYDIENAQKFPEVIEDAVLAGRSVIITEKLEGTNLALTWDPSDGREIVCQRGFENTDKQSLYWRAAAAAKSKWEIPPSLANGPLFRGEIVGPGVQGNYYGLMDLAVYWFESRRGGNPWQSGLLPAVPRVYAGPLGGFAKNMEQLVEKSTFQSALAPSRLAEGIVIRFVDTGEVLKLRSPEYLARKK